MQFSMQKALKIQKHINLNFFAFVDAEPEGATGVLNRKVTTISGIARALMNVIFISKY